MTKEEMQNLRDYIHEQVQIVAQNSDERYVVVDRLQGTFVDATRECLVRLEKHLKGEQEMYRAVLEYAKTAKTPDARARMVDCPEGRIFADDNGFVLLNKRRRYFRRKTYPIFPLCISRSRCFRNRAGRLTSRHPRSHGISVSPI